MHTCLLTYLFTIRMDGSICTISLSFCSITILQKPQEIDTRFIVFSCRLCHTILLTYWQDVLAPCLLIHLLYGCMEYMQHFARTVPFSRHQLKGVGGSAPHININPPTSPDRRVRVRLRISYLISHISYSHTRNLTISQSHNFLLS